MTAVDLARIQFALTANVHFLFVLLTLGLAPLIAFMQTRYVITGRDVHGLMTRFWGQMYIVNYALGIITGLVMEFQFGLDWTGVSRVGGEVFGAPLTLETIIAFFTEATFLGIWIFGWNLLPKAVHLIVFYLVVLTAYASAYFIMVANGFLQHPVGFAMQHGTAVVTDISALLTNSGAIDGIKHIVPAALLTGGVVVAGVSCWHLRRDGKQPFYLSSLRLGIVTSVIGGIPTIIFGFAQFDYLQTAQPLAYYITSGNGSAAQIAQAQHHMVTQFGPGQYVPPGWLRTTVLIMMIVGIGVTALADLGLFMLFRNWILRRKLALRIAAWLIPLPFIAAVCGWLTREVGRQPWAIYGVLKTPNAFAGISTAQVAFSLVLFGATVLALAVIDWTVITRLARRGPVNLTLGATLADFGDRGEGKADEDPASGPSTQALLNLEPRG